MKQTGQGTQSLRQQYEQDKEKFTEFLRNFQDRETLHIKYMEIIHSISVRETNSISIELDDLLEYTSLELVNKIENNTLRYVSLFSDVVLSLLPQQNSFNDIHSIIIAQKDSEAQGEPEKLRVVNQLKKEYSTRIIPRSDAEEKLLREVRSSDIGKLVSISGIVARVSEIRPQLKVLTLFCPQCKGYALQEVTQRTFIPEERCRSAICGSHKSPGRLIMDHRGSKFVKYQEVKLQEIPNTVPVGRTPRTIVLRCSAELVGKAEPGQIVRARGIFLPIPLAYDNLSDIYIETMEIIPEKKSYQMYEVDEQITEQVKEISQKPDVYTLLSQSISPEIWGLSDVKKALLLQMVGAPSQELSDGMKIRGDINVLLMGDPGVAKSQLLKSITGVSPRAVYTSGKGSSGAGLTAAVVRDPYTKEFALEGGSLVLADKGVCCIDEFDKMDDSDKTAIHEVMEQQTISIAKAGITTTLNARTSILAAANPSYGRYHTGKSPSENVNLPAALLSRFDIIFLLLDNPNPESDRELAEHITFVHMNKERLSDPSSVLPPDVLRGYIALARNVNPTIPKELTDFIVNAYVNLRREEVSSPNEYYYTSARSLLAILRFSLAMARIRFSDSLTQMDVEEAIRLLNQSKGMLQDKQRGTWNKFKDAKSSIYAIIRDYCVDQNSSEISHPDALQRCLAKGYTQHQFEETMTEYEAIGVWMINAAKTTIKMINWTG